MGGTPNYKVWLKEIWGLGLIFFQVGKNLICLFTEEQEPVES